MQLQRIQRMLKDKKREFKEKFKLELTNDMMGMLSGIPKSTIDNLRNFSDNRLEDYYERLNLDYSAFINKDYLLHLHRKSL